MVSEEIGPEQINKTIQCLIEAPRIWVLGLRGQYPLALLAQGMFCAFSDDVRILEFNNKESVSGVLNELLRDGAQQLIRQAVETELSEYLSQHQRIADDEDNWAL